MSFDFAKQDNFLSFLTLKQNDFLINLLEFYNKANNEQKTETVSFIKRVAVAKDMLKDSPPMPIITFVEFLRTTSHRLILDLVRFFAPHIDLGPAPTYIRTAYLIGVLVCNTPQELQTNGVFRAGMLSGGRLFECNGGTAMSVDLFRLMVLDYVAAVNRANSFMTSEPSFAMHRVWEEFLKLDFPSYDIVI